MKALSSRIRSISGSKTVQLSGIIDHLRGSGHDIISLAIGQPHEAPDPAIISQTISALQEGKTRYGAVAGLDGLRHELSEKFDGYDADNIIITNGSKQALYSALQVMCDPGDEVIIPSPFWVSFCEQIRLSGAKPVLVNTLSHQMDLTAMGQAVNDRTKAIIINSPNNPTGAVYGHKSLETIAHLAKTHDLFLISDEAYDIFLYDGLSPVSLFDFPNIRDRLIVARSFSKNHCMTGFRIGYAAAPREIVQAMARLQSHLTGNVCTFAQHGALAAQKTAPSGFAPWIERLQEKRDLTLEILKDLPCITPRGAFYAFPDVSRFLKPGESDEDLAMDILKQTHVAVAPGSAFGQNGHIRICFAVEEKRLKEGLKRLSRFFQKNPGAHLA